MNRLLDATVYLVDDDAGVREALAWMLRTRRLSNESFDSADFFLSELNTHFTRTTHLDKPPQYAAKYPSCLLLDVRMPGTTGLALFEKLIQFELLETLPVIFLTGHADLPTAVDAVKRGAFDFCEKPFSNNLLVDRIEAALALSQAAVARHLASSAVAKKVSELTEREQAVMRCVIEGLPNKLIADQLDISVRTVEVHRSRVFDKMNVKSAVELANMVRT
jgi:two-component system, LuxR family, response regulator DctR